MSYVHTFEQPRPLLPLRVRPAALCGFYHAGIGIRGWGGNISQWSDLSDRKQHLAEGTNQPAVATNQNRPSVRFNGTNQRLRNAAFAGIGSSSSLTVFVVARFLATGNRGLWELTDTADTSNRCFSHFLNGGNLFFRPGGGGADASYLFSDVTSNHVFEGIHQSANRQAFEDGVSQATNATSNTPPAPSILVVGRVESTAQPHYNNAHIHALLFYNVLLDAVERRQLRLWAGHEFSKSVTA